MLCLGSTIVGFIGFGWVLRIPGWSMLLGAVVLVWFSPLRIDLTYFARVYGMPGWLVRWPDRFWRAWWWLAGFGEQRSGRGFQAKIRSSIVLRCEIQTQARTGLV